MRERERVGEMKGMERTERKRHRFVLLLLYIVYYEKGGSSESYYYYVLYMWSYIYIHACIYNPE